MSVNRKFALTGSVVSVWRGYIAGYSLEFVFPGSRPMTAVSSNSTTRKSVVSQYVRSGGLIFLLVVLICGVWWAIERRQPDPEHLQATAVEALSVGDLATVRHHIKTLRQTPGFESAARILQARLNLRIGLPDAAIRELRPLVSGEEAVPEALTLLGESHYLLGQHADAERVLRQSLAADPGQTDARRWLASTYYDLGAMELALEQLQIVSREAPDDPRPDRLKGLIQKDFERYQEAIADYSEALRRGPDDQSRQEILVELAECQVKQHLYSEAAATASQATSTPDTLLLQAQCAHATQESEKASQLIQQALAMEPNHLDSQLLHAELLIDAGQLNDALAVLSTTMAAWPADYRLRYQLANVYRRLGNDHEAELQTSEMTRLQKLSDEFTALHEMAFSDTANAELRFRLGQIADELQKHDLAAVWYRAALGIDPSHTAARTALQRAQSTQDR